MSDFFKSDLIQDEISEIGSLQKQILQSSLSQNPFDDEHRYKHLKLLQEMLEKQKVMCTRLSLTEDPKAKEVYEQMNIISQLMGMDPNTSVFEILDEMERRLAEIERALDSES